MQAASAGGRMQAASASGRMQAASVGGRMQAASAGGRMQAASADGRIAASAGDRVRPASARRYGKQDWERLAKPRDGYARDDLIGPAKKVSAAVWERNLFLRKHGYIDNPKELLRMRFHGTSAEQSRAQNSARASAQSTAAAADMTVWSEAAMLKNCWRSGRPIPDWLQRRLQLSEGEAAGGY